MKLLETIFCRFLSLRVKRKLVYFCVLLNNSLK